MNLDDEVNQVWSHEPLDFRLEVDHHGVGLDFTLNGGEMRRYLVNVLVEDDSVVEVLPALDVRIVRLAEGLLRRTVRKHHHCMGREPTQRKKSLQSRKGCFFSYI